MRRYRVWPFFLMGALLPAIVFGADSRKAGIVKGVIVVSGRPTADAIVSVEGLPGDYLKAQTAGAKPKKAVIDQRDVKFIPRVLPVIVGTTVDFPNNDKSWHNVFSASEAKKFDLGLYAPGKTRSVTLDKAGVVRILCNVHPNMEAFVVVKEHPFFSATDKRGNYQIGGIPPGKYRLEVWHPDLGVKPVSFNMAREGEVLAIDLDLKKK
ncbi:MAG: hypothetical protein HY695_14720 [Deltaproteobacteria bacterium]|nr:hypothetical protein [Deltaproteobacteria bacterium]